MISYLNCLCVCVCVRACMVRGCVRAQDLLGEGSGLGVSRWCYYLENALLPASQWEFLMLHVPIASTCWLNPHHPR
jgi:hypothetical protein